jgi:hypothetical protein
MSRPDIEPAPRGHGLRILGTMTIMAGTGIALETGFFGFGVAAVACGASLAAVGALQGWRDRRSRASGAAAERRAESRDP